MPGDETRDSEMADSISDTAEFVSEWWRVAVFAIPDDQAALKSILMSEFNLNPIDAQIRIHGLPGLLPEPMNEAKAQRVREQIEQLGIATSLVDIQTVPLLNHPLRPHHVKCLQDGLEILGLDGSRDELIDWSEVSIVSIGYVPLETAHHYHAPTTAIASAPHHEVALSELPSMSGAEMWLMRDTVPPKAYRIDHNQMNYEYLGNRKVDSATANFQTLVGDLLERAKACYQTPATRAFVSHGPLKHFAFTSSEELQHYTLFHFLLRRRMLESR